MNSAALHNGCWQINTRALVWDKQLWIHFSFNVLEIIIALHRFFSPPRHSHTHTPYTCAGFSRLWSGLPFKLKVMRIRVKKVPRSRMVHTDAPSDMRAGHLIPILRTHKWQSLQHHISFRREIIIIYTYTLLSACILLYISGNLDCLIYCCVYSLSTAGSKATAMECLEAMASALYSELFTTLVSFINRWVFAIRPWELRRLWLAEILRRIVLF